MSKLPEGRERLSIWLSNDKRQKIKEVKKWQSGARFTFNAHPAVIKTGPTNLRALVFDWL